MSRADRNKHMIDARNQWAVTKDGAITYKNADVDHAYAEGFAAGRKNRDNELIERLQKTIKQLFSENPENPDIGGLMLAGVIVQDKS